MKNLLRPAIALMNRLSFGMKFSLISVLFFLPMLVTNFYLVRDSYAKFNATRDELQSLDLLRGTLAVRGDLETLGNLVQINAVVGQSGKAEDIEARIASLGQQAQGRLAALRPVHSDEALAKAFADKRDELLDALRSALGESSLPAQVALFDKLQTPAQNLPRLVASQSGLSQDVDGAMRQLTELLVTVTPQVTQTLGEGRAMGSYSLAQGFINSTASTRFEDLLMQLEKLSADYAMKIQEALSADRQAEARLGTAAAASQASLKQASELFESQVVVAETLDAPWAEFYQRTSDLMARTYELNDATVGFLDQQLQGRLGDYRSHMILLVVALASVFLLVVYLYSGFYASTRNTLNSLGAVMDKVAAGDMTVSYEVQSRDELGELGQMFNGTVQRIHDLIEKVGHTVSEVERQAEQVHQVSSRSNQAVSGQRGQIEQVATAMNQMSATAQEVARSAAAAVSSAHSVNQETVTGRGLVESQQGSIAGLAREIDQSVSVINQLVSDSQAISRVLEVIKSIAEQTNLLALNAAIEAARAGEQGRGFAVVADEVRTLAKRTQQSTGEIDEMISRLQNGVGAAVRAMDSSHQMASGTVSQSQQVQQALENILGAIGSIVDQNQQIAAAVEQQTAVAHDIDQNIVQINRAAEHTTQGAHQTEDASRQLSAQVMELKQLIGAFRV